MAFRPESRVDQVAAHLRNQLRQGRWTGLMPGTKKLGNELAVSHSLIDRALRLLEKEGLLVNQGPGRRRRIRRSQAKTSRMKVRVLAYEDTPSPDIIQLLGELQLAGHEAALAEKSMHALGMDTARIRRFVDRTPADAWVVVAGSRELLAWFAQRPIPAFALYGRSGGVEIAAAAPRKLPAIGQLVQRLTELGHRRIVGILRREHREPPITPVAQHFLDVLASLGIPTGSYNLPNWDDSPQDLQRLLDSLFEHTPPTALLIDEPAVLLAARDHLARKGIHAPQHLSMACFDKMPGFEWQLPAITHIAWDMEKLIRPVVLWANQVGKGREPRRLTLVDSVLIEGGTIGPAPR